jgi:putative ABC transport system substrate-binding protein
MKRREFIAMLGGGAILWPIAGHAQQPAMPVIGFLSSRSPGDATYVVRPFLLGLRAAGFIEGQNVAIEYRWGEGQSERLAGLAADLVDRQVAVIIAGGTSRQAKAATNVIPIVFTTGLDPVPYGLVASLNRPGGNITGATFYSGALAAKQLELLRELVPKAAVLGMLINPTMPSAAPQIKDAQEALPAARQFHVVNASSEEEFEPAFGRLARFGVHALLVSVDPLFDSHARQLVELAARHMIPTVYNLREFVSAGGLMSYGASIADTYHQAGVYAGLILKGAKLADLPVVLPTKFELAINLSTAKALGLTVPASLLARADEVIE